MVLSQSQALNMDDRVEPFTDGQALAWLLARPQAQIETTISDLARRWGWNRTKVLRRLRRWAADGHIVRALEPSGRSVITAMSSSVHPTSSVNNTAPIVATNKSPVHLAEQDEHRLVRPQPVPGSRAIFRITASVGFAALASVIAWFGIRINAWYGGTLGKTPEASSLIAGLSVSADVLALFLPAAGRTLWVEGHRAGSGVAWALWTITIVITLMATVGFAALNIADTTAVRGKIAAESMALRTRLDRLRAERATITETRPVTSIEAELQRAQPSAAAVWRATAGCRDVTLPESGQACAAVLALRQALGTARRRDNWATFGLVKLAADDIRMARIAGMALMPQIAGLVLMVAAILWPSGRPQAPR